MAYKAKSTRGLGFPEASKQLKMVFLGQNNEISQLEQNF